jgi:exopolyphosphatase/guanosine-5'-triphosphate,3'-diphosphate pyrophosphatase
MGKRIAIIDLGTNTFNLLIAEAQGLSSYHILYCTKEGVKLGAGGINRRHITEAAAKRGIEAVARHFERIKPYKVDKVVAYATSAIRDADNGRDFAAVLNNKFGLEVRVIDGDTEAQLIYAGVKQTLPFVGKRYIVLDIGGGSNEFIIADDNGVLWKRSFPLGMARLLERFSPSDPISASEIKTIEAYLNTELTELFENAKLLKPEIFVGASGSFDSFVLMLANEGLIESDSNAVSRQLPLEIYDKLHQKLIHSTADERDRMEGLEPVRRDMIVLATIFVNFVLERLAIKTLYQSAYSLKEGAILGVIKEIQ